MAAELTGGGAYNKYTQNSRQKFQGPVHIINHELRLYSEDRDHGC